MQERAAAALAIFFLAALTAAGAMYVTAAPPAVTVDDPDFTLGVSDEFTIGERSYTLTEIDDDDATVEWLEEDAEFSESWDNSSTIELDDVSFSVITDANATPPTVTLEEVQELDEDVDVVEVDGEEFVVVEENDTRELVPVDEYLRERYGEPERLIFELGDTFEYQDRTVTVSEITEGAAVITWIADRIHEQSLAHRGEVTLGPDGASTSFAVHIEGPTAYLIQDIEGYQAQWDAVDRFNERKQGLFGIGVISSIAAGLVILLAFNPVRRT